jgi:hypothetical protein
MKILIAVSVFFGMSSFASLSIKPGLWTVQTKMIKDGKEFDPQAQMKAMMARMSSDQKKKIQSLISKNSKGGASFGMSDQGMQVCINNEVLQKEEFLNPYSQYDCETTFPTKTPTQVVAQFKCKNGSSGTVDWNVKDSTHYQGAVKMNDKSGNKTEINYLGAFVSANCGKVKPIDFSKLKKPAKK